MSVDEIKKLVKTDKLIIGFETTMKALKAKELKKVYLAKNISDDARKEIIYNAQITSLEVEELDMLNNELGLLCKKPFNISCVGIKA